MPVEIDLAVAVQFVLNIALLIGAVVGGLVWIRRWLQKQVVDPATKTYEQLAPNGGSQDSTRHLIEETRNDVAEWKAISQDNRDRSIRAEAKADTAVTLIQQHTQGHP